MGKFENILIFSDIDGTYLGNGRRIIPRNEEAVRYFRSEGGLFTFATGRMEYTLLNAIPNLFVSISASLPAILSTLSAYLSLMSISMILEYGGKLKVSRSSRRLSLK